MCYPLILFSFASNPVQEPSKTFPALFLSVLLLSLAGGERESCEVPQQSIQETPYILRSLDLPLTAVKAGLLAPCSVSPRVMQLKAK